MGTAGNPGRLSVVVALVVGIIVLLVEKLGIESGPLTLIGTLDLNYVGYIVVDVFVVTWAGCVGDLEVRAARGAVQHTVPTHDCSPLSAGGARG